MKNKLRKVGLLCLMLSTQIALALPFNLTLRAGSTLPTQVVQGDSVKALYTVTNNTLRTLKGNYVKYLPPNVTQVITDPTYSDLCSSSFDLTSGGSCTLELAVVAAVDASNSDSKQHLFVCNPEIPDCSGTAVSLNVTLLPLTMKGTVQSGGTITTAISNATVNVYGADTTSATLVGTATTNSLGQFFMNIPTSSMTHTLYYAVASKDSSTVLMNVLGESVPSSIVINELTTVGGAFSMAQFLQSNAQLYGKALGLSTAAGMNDNLVVNSTGQLSSVITSNPNGDETNTMRSLNSLANLLTPCVQGIAGKCATLFGETTHGSNVPTNTLDALINLSHYPANHASTLYCESLKSSLFTPYLAAAPDAWTLAVKVNDTGDDNYLFGGPAKLVFDSKGYAWVTNNVIQGGPDSSDFFPVLKPNGQPSDGANGTPISPILGGGTKGQAFGMGIDTYGFVWVGNFGWGSCDTCIPTPGSVSKFSSSGSPISESAGYAGYAAGDTTTPLIKQAQGTTSDRNNNIWIASYANSRVVLFPGGDQTSAVYFDLPSGSNPFEIVIDTSGYAWVSCSGTSKLTKLSYNGSSISEVLTIAVGDTPKGITVDSADNIWVASGGDSSVYKVTSDGNSIIQYTGIGGMNGPWGVALDGNDNVLVANFGPLTLVGLETPGILPLTLLCGTKDTTCITGEAITPSSGYTLPSAGDPVRLHNGVLLEGEGSVPKYKPLMRVTYAAADSAGNVWAINNWKPVPENITTGFNPGGDGIVIFVGIAKPK